MEYYPVPYNKRLIFCGLRVVDIFPAYSHGNTVGRFGWLVVGV